MIRNGFLLATGVAMLAAATPAQALTYQTVEEVKTGRTGGSYTGVGTVNIFYTSTTSIDDSGTCTGSLVAANVVLTAAHCLDSTNDPVVGIVFDLPSYGERSAESTYYAVSGSWVIHPNYKNGGSDIALFTLTTEATGHDVYEIYQDDPIGKDFTRVGTGLVGGPEGEDTGGVEQKYNQQQGRNTYEYHGDEVLNFSNENVLLSDFDDGTDVHDAFGVTKGTSHLGVAGESDGASGDSGSPTFIDGKIVGILSGGTSASVLTTADCATPGNVDPYMSDNGACSNSSIGEISNDNWVKPFTSYINDYIAAAAVIPEPSSWAMMILGFGAIGVGLRRRPRTRAGWEARSIGGVA